MDADNKHIGDVGKIKPCPDDINDLRKAVKTEWSPNLDYTNASALLVHTDLQKKPLEADAAVPTSTCKKPLIVIAPAKEAQGTPVSYCLYNQHW